MSFKEKSYEWMQKHPKITSAIVGSAVTVGGTVAMLPVSVTASAEGEAGQTVQQLLDIGTISETLVSNAQTAYSTAINKSLPIIASVIGFNVVLRLVRRFVKG